MIGNDVCNFDISNSVEAFFSFQAVDCGRITQNIIKTYLIGILYIIWSHVIRTSHLC